MDGSSKSTRPHAWYGSVLGRGDGVRNRLVFVGVRRLPDQRAPDPHGALWGNQEIGSIDALFVEQEQLAKLGFTLGAKTWKAVDIDWRHGVVRVEPVPAADLARWQGRPILFGDDLCQATRAVLVSQQMDEPWSQRAPKRIAQIRAEHAFLSETGLDLVDDATGYRLWTFGGGRANNLLAKVLDVELGGRVTTHNGYIGFREDAAKSRVGIHQALDKLRAEHRPNEDDARRFAQLCARRRISKFEPCLTERLQAELLAAALTDPETAQDVLGIVVHDRQAISVDDRATPSPIIGAKVSESFGDYDLEIKLRGGMAESYIARHRPSNEKVFLKRVVQSGDWDNSALQRELQIYNKLQRMECPAILDIRDVVSLNGYLALVTELADGGDLSDYVLEQHSGSISPKEAKTIALEVGAGIEALHDRPIIHRDLKPENVLRAD